MFCLLNFSAGWGKRLLLLCQKPLVVLWFLHCRVFAALLLILLGTSFPVGFLGFLGSFSSFSAFFDLKLFGSEHHKEMFLMGIILTSSTWISALKPVLVQRLRKIIVDEWDIERINIFPSVPWLIISCLVFKCTFWVSGCLCGIKTIYFPSLEVS